MRVPSRFISVSDVPGSPPLLCKQDTTIREAAQMLASSKATCVFVVGASGAAIGIVTDRDFAEKVVAQALPLDRTVTEIMSSPVVAVEASERLFLALLAILAGGPAYADTGRLGGMVGQLEYAAANEALARLGRWADRLAGYPVMTLAWPTWDREIGRAHV